MAAPNVFGIPDALTGSNWIEHPNRNQRDNQRDYFMQEVHRMPNGGSPKYNPFFERFLDKLHAYQAAHNPRMMTTPDDFYSLVSILKHIHTRGNSRIPHLEELVKVIERSHHFDNPDPPSRQMIEYSIWLGMWAWLQITLQKKMRGGALQVFEEAGQIVHPWSSDESVWTTIDNDLPRSPLYRLRKRYHEFSLRLNFIELTQATESRITFEPTSNLLEHLRILKDKDEKYSMVVYIFHNRPMLYALFNGNNKTPEWHKDLAQETLNTLVLLAAYDVNGGAASFEHIFGVDLLEPMEDEPFDYDSDEESDEELDDDSDEEVEQAAQVRGENQPPQNQPPQNQPPQNQPPQNQPPQNQAEPSVYISRSLHSYPYWGARLLELEEVVRGQNPSTFNEYHQEQQEEEAARREKDVRLITIWAFILSVALLILTIVTLAYGVKATDQAKKANVYASTASVVADSSVAQLSSFLAGCGVPYCTRLIGENNTVPLTMTTFAPTTTAFFTVTATAFTTATVSDTVTITSTIT